MSDTAEFTIPSTSSLGVPINNSVSVATSSSTEFKANGGDIKNVKEIRLIKLFLATVQPSAQIFSFLNSIHIYISADDLGETEIAYLENIPSNVGNSIDLVTTEAVLDKYIKKENYSLRFKTVTDEILTEDVTIKAEMSFRVKAKIL